LKRKKSIRSLLYNDRVYKSVPDFVNKHSLEELYQAHYVRGLKNKYGDVSNDPLYGIPIRGLNDKIITQGIVEVDEEMTEARKGKWKVNWDKSTEGEIVFEGELDAIRKAYSAEEEKKINMQKYSYPEGDHYVTEEYLKALSKALDAEKWEQARESVEELTKSMNASKEAAESLEEPVCHVNLEADPAEVARCEDLIEQQLDAWYRATPDGQRDHGITIGPLTDDEVVLDKLVERYDGWKTEIVLGNSMHFYPK